METPRLASPRLRPRHAPFQMVRRWIIIRSFPGGFSRAANVPQTLICGSYRGDATTAAAAAVHRAFRTLEIASETSPWYCQSKDAAHTPPDTPG